MLGVSPHPSSSGNRGSHMAGFQGRHRRIEARGQLHGTRRIGDWAPAGGKLRNFQEKGASTYYIMLANWHTVRVCVRVCVHIYKMHHGYHTYIGGYLSLRLAMRPMCNKYIGFRVRRKYYVACRSSHASPRQAACFSYLQVMEDRLGDILGSARNSTG